VHDAITQRERGGLVPVVLGRHAGVLADGEPELGEDGTLDLSQREFVDGLAGRGIMERLICQLGTLTVRLNRSISTLRRGRNPGITGLCDACSIFMQGPGRFSLPWFRSSRAHTGV
jgi:hypothetical protein